MKWIFFIRELLQPVHVPPGTVWELEDQVYAELMQMPEGREGMLNVTPRAIKRELGRYFSFPVFFEKPDSPCMIYPCPSCMVFDQAKRAWLCIKPYTHCSECKGAQSVVVDRLYDRNELRRRITEAVKLKGKTDGR